MSNTRKRKEKEKRTRTWSLGYHLLYSCKEPLYIIIETKEDSRKDLINVIKKNVAMQNVILPHPTSQTYFFSPDRSIGMYIPHCMVLYMLSVAFLSMYTKGDGGSEKRRAA
jgi:hypothetical protein